MAQLEQIPSLAMRHQLLTEAHQALRQHSTVSLSYVGRAAMGAAERYVREIQTEATSLHAILVEVSAAGGSFCISFMQMFAEDNYLNAFLNELWPTIGNSKSYLASFLLFLAQKLVS